jgi:penicillin-binding protein 2
MMEKYLNDTLRAESKKKAEYIAGSDLMPPWIAREQYKADSTRARYWFKLTKDSSYLKKYLPRSNPSPAKKDSGDSKPPQKIAFFKFDAINPDKQYSLKKKPISA